VELHPPPACLLILDGHDHAVRGDGGDLEAPLDLPGDRVQGVVAARGELVRKPGEQSRATRGGPPDLARLAVRGLGEQAQFSPGVLHHGLQPEADTERGESPRVKLAKQGVTAEIAGLPRAG
jgi:hypothetical protein